MLKMSATFCYPCSYSGDAQVFVVCNFVFTSRPVVREVLAVVAYGSLGIVHEIQMLMGNQYKIEGVYRAYYKNSHLYRRNFS